MTYYCVYLEVHPEESWDCDTAILDNFMDRLEFLHGVAIATEQGWGAEVTVEALGIHLALPKAIAHVIYGAAHDAGLPLAPIVRIEVVREDVRNAELEIPQPCVHGIGCRECGAS